MEDTNKPRVSSGGTSPGEARSSASPAATDASALDDPSKMDIDFPPGPSSRDLYGPKETRRIYKNLVGLGLSFMLLFSAYMATLNLQSTINAESGLGMVTLAVIFGTTVIVALFLPPLVMKYLKVKLTLLVSVIGFAAYEACQFETSYYTFMPAAFILGICGALIWAAVQTYMAKIAEEYAFLTKQTSTAVLQHFFGIFFLFFHFSQIWGNLVSSAVLSSGSQKVDVAGGHGGPVSTPNSSNPDMFEFCGPHFCPFEAEIGKDHHHNSSENVTALDHDSPVGHNLARPPQELIYLLFSIFLGFVVLSSLIIAFLVDSLQRYGEAEKKGEEVPVTGLLIATVKHLLKPYQMLLIPITVWLGIQEGLLGADFTQAYVGCAWGVQNIGFVMMCFGVCAALGSGVVGKLMKWFGRTALFVAAALMDLSCLLIMRFWTPHPDEKWVFFVVAALWGLGDVVWSPQIKALYGALFPDTAAAASSNTILWTSVGFIIVFVLQGALCMTVKVYLYIGFLAFSMACYVVIEIMERRKAKKNAMPIEDLQLEPHVEPVLSEDMSSVPGGTGGTGASEIEDRQT